MRGLGPPIMRGTGGLPLAHFFVAVFFRAQLFFCMDDLSDDVCVHLCGDRLASTCRRFRALRRDRCTGKVSATAALIADRRLRSFVQSFQRTHLEVVSAVVDPLQLTQSPAGVARLSLRDLSLPRRFSMCVGWSDAARTLVEVDVTGSRVGDGGCGHVGAQVRADAPYCRLPEDTFRW